MRAKSSASPRADAAFGASSAKAVDPSGRAPIVLAMRDPTKTVTPADLPPTAGRRASRRSRFIQIAPGPEAPDSRDKAGAQGGMVLMLIGGGLFWAAVAAAAIYVLRS